MIFFAEGSPNADIREAVRSASEIRKALREEGVQQAAQRAAAAIEQNSNQPGPIRGRYSQSRTVIKSRKS
jgi:hypothetical protein